jgi:glutamyl-tRNA reductase
METNLRSISISHLSAPVRERERFYFPEGDKKVFTEKSRERFPDIAGMMLLVTCNRTEVYFESVATTSAEFLDFFLRYTGGERRDGDSGMFTCTDTTEKTAYHLLRVSSGLLSRVLGDAEIISQIKKAYQFSIAMHMQGSLLERSMQMVFRNHKRVRNETQFRDGTTSLAYKSLKMMVQHYGKDAMEDKKILFIGAGDIVKQLFKYNGKFKFRKIWISNRTEKNARTLTRKYGCELFEWNRVLANDFGDFDIIVGAAGNSLHLIKALHPEDKPRLLIDLGLPSNIDPKLSRLPEVFLYDLDAISTDLESAKVQRARSVEAVRKINREELESFRQWLDDAALRKMLSRQKIVIHRNTAGYLIRNMNVSDPEKVAIVTKRVIRKLYHQKCRSTSEEYLTDLIAEQSVFDDH